MNTSHPVLYPASALDSWTLPQTLTRCLARWVHGSRRTSRTAGPTVLRLGKGATAWIDRPLGRRVTSESGTLWLCFDGEPQDIVLEPGETHCCENGSPLSIHALSAAAARVD